MADTRPIPTPLTYRWRRFLQQILPVIIFVFGLVMTIWLWDRQSLMGNARGVVDSRFVDVSSGIAGILLPPNHGRWERFQTVKKNEVIGSVSLYEDDTYNAQLATIDKQKAKVRADFRAEQTRFLFDIRRQNQGQWFDAHRLYWQLEEYMINIMDRTTEIEVSRATLNRLEKSLVYDVKTYERGATSEQELIENQLQKEQIEMRILQERIALDQANRRLTNEKERLAETEAQLETYNEQNDAIKGVINALAAPYAKQLEVLNAQAKEIEAQLNAPVIRAPIDGFITEVFAVPGQSVQPGDPVVRIAGYDRQFLVSYIRDRQRIRPTPGMSVRLRTHFTGSRPVEARVLDVGQFVEEVPLQHRVDPVQPEWGFPVKIELPPDFPVRPGDAVDIIFPARARMADEADKEPTPNVGV